MGECLPEPLPDRTEWINGRSGADGIVMDGLDAASVGDVRPYLALAAAFVLREAFGHSHREIAEIQELTRRTSGSCTAGRAR